jgi:D-alanyl-D-alanine carboxypeptidase
MGRQFDMQAALNQTCKTYGVPAIGCAIFPMGARGGVWVSGVRQAGQTTAVATNDTWLIDSNVKSMTGVLIANEIQKGTLQWDEKLSKALPGVKIDPSYAGATIQSLETMIGGLDDAPPKGWAAYEGDDMTQQRKKLVADVLAAKPTKATAGQFLYSDASYVILSTIAEKLEDLAFDDVMQRQLWYPMPLDAAAWGPNNDNEPVGHDAMGMPHVGADDPPILDGAGRARMTIRNWGEFLRQVMGSFKGNHRFVPPAYDDALNAAPLESYVLGWFKTKQPWATGYVLWQEGDDSLSHAVVWLDPNGAAYVAVCNQGGDKAKTACDEAIKTMIANQPRQKDN